MPQKHIKLKFRNSKKFNQKYSKIKMKNFRGCFGKVYLCKEKNTQLNLAAKCIRLTRDSDRKKVEKEVIFFALKRRRDWPFTRWSPQKTCRDE